MTPKMIKEAKSLGLKLDWNDQRSLKCKCLKCLNKNSLIIYPGKFGGKYKCLNCENTGDLVKFITEFKGYSLHQAITVKKKESEAYFDLQAVMYDFRPKPHPVKDRKLWNSCVQDFHEYTREEIKKHQEVYKWLKLNWGINRASVKRAGIGYNPENIWIDEWCRWGMEPILKPNGKSQKLWLPKGLVIPNFYGKNRISRIRFKNISPDEKWQYWLLPGSNMKPVLLGNRKSNNVIVVIHELDAILANQELPEEYVIGLGSVINKLSYHYSETLDSRRLIPISSEVKFAILDVPAAVESTFPTEWETLGEAFVDGLDLRKYFKIR